MKSRFGLGPVCIPIEQRLGTHPGRWQGYVAQMLRLRGTRRFARSFRRGAIDPRSGICLLRRAAQFRGRRRGRVVRDIAGLVVGQQAGWQDQQKCNPRHQQQNHF